MTKIIIVCLLFFGFSLSVLAQEDKETVEITGIVTDQNKETLVGVSIYVAEIAGLGTITDGEGKYKIKVPKYQRLTFSYIGYDKVEVLIKEQRVVNVTLNESENSLLDEVVVTGTGTQKKVSVTGAITTVDVKELQATSASNVSNALAGNVPGVMAWTTSGQPGKNRSEFWIRGISTFGAGSSAYVLVDGFERDLNDLNIEDIESFTVLKDASATAIYGSKGANGVILITTKRGKAGKVNIDAKVETSYNTRTITPEFVDGFTYANLLNESRITRNQEPVYQPEELEILRLGLDPDLYPNVDWKNLLLKDGASNYRANLNISGGGSTARYYVSASYLEEQGMYNTDQSLRDDYNTNANYSRWTYRLNTDMDITKTTVLKVGVSGTLGRRNSPGLGDGDVWGQIFGYSPISTPIIYSNGYIPALGTGNQTNPWVSATQTGYNENWTNRIQTNVSLEQNLDFIAKGLQFTGRFGYDTNNNNDIRRLKWPEQWKAERARNADGDLVFTHISDPSEMHQESSSSGDRREFLDLMFNYDRTLKEHHFSGTVKYTQDAYIQTQNLGGDIKNGVSKRNQGLAGRVAYNWKLKYFADFNFGYTGSENFAIGHQFGYFPAYSLAWNLAEEGLVKSSMKWVNMFKIRYSHGKVGNDNMGERFPYLYTIESGVAGYQWADYNFDRSFDGMRFSQVASTYVTWEVATKNDLGLDLSLFNNKFSANLDYFEEKREGIYMARNYLPAMVGLESVPKANVGAVSSEGFDGRFAYKEKVGSVNMTVRGNLTYSKNEILERDEENNVYPYQMERGYRVDQSRGLIALGLFEDYDDIRNSPEQTFGEYQPGDIKYKDVNGDGVINDGDVVAIGATRRPNLIYGAGASAGWKGLDINVLFQGAGKSTFTLTGKTAFAFSEGEWGVPLKAMMESDRWISADISGDPATENPNASYPRLSYGGNANNYRSSTFWLRNGAYLRLKTIDIGYTLPKKIVNKYHFNNLRIYLMGTNLLTWSNFKLWDPELGSRNGEQYPLTKSVTLGLTINL
ncbi:SusC/RagA family TonB-linked outer membrane protein [Gaoshiqia sediminis]|uniref:TonB-dependent receptor n=1 Tax=Gaoshiqia sediminis TaxID=2986998 RepID=A0AA42C9I9_9BACT|nr:TonB-dependent receptor [Gaoshiqia sediminis]MCW0484021.1 TonB-dependent receptor [Gaoshiqia sediminis]